ncbi:glycosyltransferase family 2 protein [Aquimarina mytili]|uniref:Glycosyltransferase family 2 protein n=1 Tax=Aquimarina mytili TaxID=874423 RepID=A0A937D9F5_9FLAO|nr:glycosyltransferase family 2 protein [Aquimarina mytili]MBL0685015.1 glycosyltransferase family 2 protein [Aquimarina mytili]
MKVKTALIISTYNWPEALELVLKSVANQSIMTNEVLIADDGSRDETKLIIEKFREQVSIPLNHVWHEDLGFRKGKVLNKAIASTNADYIIEVDGDCIMHRDFIKDHLDFIKKDVFLYGSRVNIQKDYLPVLFKKQKISFNFLSKGIKKRTRALRIPIFGYLFTPKSKLSKKIRGCNISFWREDVIKVNGYNESIEGWGREDSELIVRMLNNGCVGRRLRYRGIVYHIWHSEKSRDKVQENDRIQQLSKEKALIWCEDGIDKYLNN